MRTRLGTIVLAAAVGTACVGAPRARTFPDIAQCIEPGSTVHLTEVSGAKTTGRLASLSPDSMAILADGSRREVPEHQVARISRPVRRAGRGALLGFGLGMVLGLAMPGSKPAPEYGLVAAQGAAVGMVVLAGLGSVVGAVGGAFIKGTQTVYEAPKKRAPTRPVGQLPVEGDPRTSPSRPRAPATAPLK